MRQDNITLQEAISKCRQLLIEHKFLFDELTYQELENFLLQSPQDEQQVATNLQLDTSLPSIPITQISPIFDFGFDSKLAESAIRQDRDEAERLIATGADPTLALLTVVLNNRDIEATRFLVELGANTSVILASVAQIRNTELAMFMISVGAKLVTALLLAVGDRDVGEAEFLIELGAIPHQALVIAANNKNLEKSKFLIDELDAHLEKGLLFALTMNNSSAAKFLIDELHADPTRALVTAISDDYPEQIQQALLELGADAQHEDVLLAENNSRQSNVVIITNKDDANAARNIRSSKDLTRVTEEIASALIRAVYKSNTNTIDRILQKNNLSVDIVIDDIGTTLLQHAVSEGELQVVKHLIDNLNANPNVENNMHFTALDTALFFSKRETAAFLIERDAVGTQEKSDTNVIGSPTLN